MTKDLVQFPIDDMSATSQNLQSFLELQWSQHQSLFMSNSDSYSTLLLTIAKILPGGSGKAEELRENLASYHQQYQDAYDQLSRLAKEIDRASQAMNITDHNVAKGFTSYPDAKPS